MMKTKNDGPKSGVAQKTACLFREAKLNSRKFYQTALIVVMAALCAAAGNCAAGPSGAPDRQKNVSPNRRAAAEGLLAWYSFDDGSDTAVKNLAGDWNHGVIHGARPVKTGDGFALEIL